MGLRQERLVGGAWPSLCDDNILRIPGPQKRILRARIYQRRLIVRVDNKQKQRRIDECQLLRRRDHLGAATSA